MVWQRLFPSEGGGALRRWIRLQRAMYEKSMDSEHLVKGPVSLFDFAEHDDAVDAAGVNSGAKQGGWRISDDEVIGGFSRGNASLIRSYSDYERYLKVDEPGAFTAAGEPTTCNARNDQDSFTPFLRWRGNIDTRIGEKSRVVRSGFAALRAPEFPFGGANIGNRYNALEFTFRTDGRPYTVNLKVSSYFPDDLYQHLIDVPRTHMEDSLHTVHEFARVVLPFRDFLLTASGRIRETQRELDGGFKIETVGITLMDGKDGEFQFDLARIRAVNFYHDEILGEDDEEAPY